MATESHFYQFSEDFATRVDPKLRTGKFLGKAVLVDNVTPKELHVLALIEDEPRRIKLDLYGIQEVGYKNGFVYRLDEAKKICHVSTDVRITNTDGKLLFLSPQFWSIPFHRSVYDKDVEFNTINKAIFSPKENYE